jgi:hypothetical protein
MCSSPTSTGRTTPCQGSTAGFGHFRSDRYRHAVLPHSTTIDPGGHGPPAPGGNRGRSLARRGSARSPGGRFADQTHSNGSSPLAWRQSDATRGDAGGRARSNRRPWAGVPRGDYENSSRRVDVGEIIRARFLGHIATRDGGCGWKPGREVKDEAGNHACDSRRHARARRSVDGVRRARSADQRRQRCRAKRPVHRAPG